MESLSVVNGLIKWVVKTGCVLHVLCTNCRDVLSKVNRMTNQHHMMLSEPHCRGAPIWYRYVLDNIDICDPLLEECCTGTFRLAVLWQANEQHLMVCLLVYCS